VLSFLNTVAAALNKMSNADLPIYEIEQPLLQALRAHKRVILTAPTGSGKSTQVPQMLLDKGLPEGG
jgi:ATP-dependent helicase HrpB